MTIGCLVVEDQPPAQRILMRYIEQLPHLELAAVCSNAFEAMSALHAHAIDLMFLDLNMPRMGGFEFLRSLSRPPRVIVTTAYPEHAVEGFELDVVDYLVKPFSFERFVRAVARVSTMGSESKPAETAPSPARSSAEEVFVKVDGALQRLALDDIIFIRAEGDYVSIVTTTGRLFLAGTMTHWEERLPEHRFVRAHKSYIVGLAHIERIVEATIQTPAGGVPIGRSYRERLFERLG